MHTANCGELANIAWAYGLLQIHHERLYQEVARRANVRLQDFKQQASYLHHEHYRYIYL